MTVGAAFPREPMARNALVSATDTTLQGWLAVYPNAFCVKSCSAVSVEFILPSACPKLLDPPTLLSQTPAQKETRANKERRVCICVCVCVRVSVGTLAVLISTHRCIAKYVQSIAIYQVSKYTTVECSARQSSITLNFEFPCRDPPQTCISFKRFCGFHTQFCNWCWQNSAICACGVDLCWLESLWQAPPTAFSLADAIGISSAAFASVLVNVARLHYGNSMEFDGSTLVFHGFSTVSHRASETSPVAHCNLEGRLAHQRCLLCNWPWGREILARRKALVRFKTSKESKQTLDCGRALSMLGWRIFACQRCLASNLE